MALPPWGPGRRKSRRRGRIVAGGAGFSCPLCGGPWVPMAPRLSTVPRPRRSPCCWPMGPAQRWTPLHGGHGQRAGRDRLACGAHWVPLHGSDAGDGATPGPDRMPELQKALRQQVNWRRRSNRAVRYSSAASRWSAGSPACWLMSWPPAMGCGDVSASAIPSTRPDLRDTGGGGELCPLNPGSAAVDRQRRPQLQTHQELGPQRGEELGHGR